MNSRGVSDWKEERHFRVDAKRGSKMLLLAILKAQAPKKGRKPRKPQQSTSGIFEPHPKVARIQRAVAEFYGLPVKRLHNVGRARWFSHPRQVTMYVAHEMGVSLPCIGRHFGKDHTTVLHACRVVPMRPNLFTAARHILANIGDKSTNFTPLPMRNSQEKCKEHSGNTQEERLAA